MSTAAARPRPGGPAMPQGQEVASFATYGQAQHAVDALSDEGFPVQYLAIVGTDLRQVEHITGRMSWGRAALSGALSGLWLGLFFGLLLTLMGPGGSAGALMGAAVGLGILWGMVFQLLGYAMTRGRRDFTSTSAVVASRYSIIASAHAADAARALAPLPGNLSRGGEAERRAQERRAARQARLGQGPTPFGSRPDEQPRYGVRLPQGGHPGQAPSAGADAPGKEETDGAPQQPAVSPAPALPVPPAPADQGTHGQGDQADERGEGADRRAH